MISRLLVSSLKKILTNSSEFAYSPCCSNLGIINTRRDIYRYRGNSALTRLFPRQFVHLLYSVFSTPDPPDAALSAVVYARAITTVIMAHTLRSYARGIGCRREQRERERERGGARFHLSVPQILLPRREGRIRGYSLDNASPTR